MAVVDSQVADLAAGTEGVLAEAGAALTGSGGLVRSFLDELLRLELPDATTGCRFTAIRGVPSLQPIVRTPFGARAVFDVEIPRAHEDLPRGARSP